MSISTSQFFKLASSYELAFLDNLTERGLNSPATTLLGHPAHRGDVIKGKKRASLNDAPFKTPRYHPTISMAVAAVI